MTSATLCLREIIEYFIVRWLYFATKIAKMQGRENITEKDLKLVIAILKQQSLDENVTT
jgi:histone H3/H4